MSRAGLRRVGGGLPARRAVIRWAWRLFRREWRQQALVLALLAVAVAAAVLGVSAGYHISPVPEATFGTARQQIRFETDPEAGVAAARDWFGRVEVIRHWYVAAPGSDRRLELRAQDPHGPFGAPMLRLLAGRYPATAGEVAITDRVAATFGLRVGGRLTAGGRSWDVVGLVENPGALDLEFALLAPTRPEPPDSVTVLTAADPARFDRFRQLQGGVPAYAVRESDSRMVAAAAVFSFFAVGLLLICFVATAGFAVVAHRRIRQLGLLSAIGGTQRHVRLVLLADGAAVGAAAAVVGTVVGLASWFALAPRLETAAAHRIGRLDLPWWQLAVAMLLSVAAATAAAWRPGRTVARIPTTLALSARPPAHQPAHRSAIAAVALIATGIGCLAIVGRTNPLLADAIEIGELALIVAGILATGVGLLFAGPLAIRALAAAGARLPVAARLALRDLARHQARSGAAVAAISLALAIPTAVVVLARAGGDGSSGLLGLRWTATAAGAVLALAVLAMTIGLIRVEAGADLRILAATGATARIRRTHTAVTAGGLALLGALLGIAVAYADLAAGAAGRIAALARVPVLELTVTAVVVPLLAAGAGWVLAGREPRSLTRTRLE